jgi:hypothetical protein
MKRRIVILGIALAVCSPSYAFQGKGKGHGRGHEKHQESAEAPVTAFRPADRTYIATYYQTNPNSLPPGLAKRNGDLPPGLQKQLRRNGQLPPGLQKRLVAFPPEVESHLPPCPPDVRRGLIGGVAVMWSTRTGLILDAAAVWNP